MAKRIFTWGGSFPASSVGASAGSSNTGFMALKGGSTTQIVDLLEIMLTGMASNSAVAGFCVRYTSTLGSVTTALAQPATDGPMIVNATALANTVVAYIAATSAPVISNSTALPTLQVGLNAFGGIVRWNAAPTQQWTQIGNASLGGESVLFNSTTLQGVTTNANAHIIYEPY